MALDAIQLEMIAARVSGARILCLGYPDLTATEEEIRRLLGVKPRKLTPWGRDHGVDRPLAETIDTLMLAGAVEVHCIDVRKVRGMEEIRDLNERQYWGKVYDVVINPGTIEHCFAVSTAMFNAWAALEVGGVIISASPMSMMNHGFYNLCPTFFEDFATANGGRVVKWDARDRDGKPVAIDKHGRFRVPPEAVLYSLMEKTTAAREMIPVQGRFR